MYGEDYPIGHTLITYVPYDTDPYAKTNVFVITIQGMMQIFVYKLFDKNVYNERIEYDRQNLLVQY